MKALSIQQPWATAILRGIKIVENRMWSTTHRGDLVIHAGQTVWRHVAGTGGIHQLMALDKYEQEALRSLEPFDALPTGALIGVVNLLGCQPIKDSVTLRSVPFARGPVCWLFAEPREFKRPWVYRGKLGLFDVQDAIVEMMLKKSKERG